MTATRGLDVIGRWVDVRGLVEAAMPGKVVLVAQSMGGLIVRRSSPKTSRPPASRTCAARRPRWPAP